MFDVIAVGEAVISKDVAIVPELLNDLLRATHAASPGVKAFLKTDRPIVALRRN